MELPDAPRGTFPHHYFEIMLVKDILHYLQHSKLGTLDIAY